MIVKSQVMPTLYTVLYTVYYISNKCFYTFCMLAFIQPKHYLYNLLIKPNLSGIFSFGDEYKWKQLILKVEWPGMALQYNGFWMLLQLFFPTHTPLTMAVKAFFPFLLEKKVIELLAKEMFQHAVFKALCFLYYPIIINNL
uniref:Uncharacterized protein n=1 Tax=Pyxicephalus adspersus TaxID=30357 RepID=A0AAV3ACP3_PYXAD|nr:TPA: hypothetical protein GDO54_009323 [Pyxicephalus adspersus]